MPFRKYMHVEKFGNDEVEVIELGDCYVFPKLDGTNASIWWDDESFSISCGSRKRVVTVGDDNAGFAQYVYGNQAIESLSANYPHWNIYGEWLVPHSLKTYSDDAWRKFYIFDIWDNENNEYVAYDDYKEVLDVFGVNYIPPLCVVRNTTYDNLLVELENNWFLIRDGEGAVQGS